MGAELSASRNGVTTLRFCSFSAALLVLSSVLGLAHAAAQAVSPAALSTWDVYGGGSFLGSTASSGLPNSYGWDFSVSERPYSSYPWLGGTAEASGDYSKASTPGFGTTTTQTTRSRHTVMGGPTFVLLLSHVQPYAHALVGGVFVHDKTGTAAQSVSSSSTHFGYALGGGLDVPLAIRWTIRGQADWIGIWANTSSNENLIRASAGVVFHF
jgi:opacity protein-like surface antigen